MNTLPRRAPTKQSVSSRTREESPDRAEGLRDSPAQRALHLRADSARARISRMERRDLLLRLEQALLEELHLLAEVPLASLGDVELPQGRVVAASASGSRLYSRCSREST